MVGRERTRSAPTATLRGFGGVGSSENDDDHSNCHMDGMLRDRDLLEGMTQRRLVRNIQREEKVSQLLLGIDIPRSLGILSSLSGMIEKGGHSRRYSLRTSRRWWRNFPILVCLVVMISFMVCGVECSGVAGGDGQTIGTEKEVSVVGYTYDEWSVLEGVIKVR